MDARKNSQISVYSKLLSHEENEVIFKLLGSRCQPQVIAVVQVYGTEGSNHSSWVKVHCGVATFTKDSNRRSYFIQVFDVSKEKKLFEQEIYHQFTYHASLPFFHQFEGENQMIGLNFADNQEAELFYKIVSDRLAAKQRKKEERRRQQNQELTHQQPQQQQYPPPSKKSFQQQPIQKLPTSSLTINKAKLKKGRKTSKLSKDQIGEPMNFKHITHVGFDQDKGLSINNSSSDAALNEFFKMAGVSENLLRDDNTRKFIYDFIDQHGGIERATEETKVYGSVKRTRSSTSVSSSNVKPTLPSRNNSSGVPPPPPPRPQQFHPLSAPPPPPKDRSMHEKPTAALLPTPAALLPTPAAVKMATPIKPPSTHPHSMVPPPPPPRIPSNIARIAPIQSTPIQLIPPTPASTNTIPPPPPPPPPPAQPTPPPPPAQPTPPPPPAQPTPPSHKNIPPDSIQGSNARSDLLEQIRQRPTLNPVSQKRIERVEQDSRTTLLSEIRNKEYELKPVTPNEGEAPGFTGPAENTMAAMLAKALIGRAKVIQDESDSDEDEDEEDEDDWDEN